MEQKTTAGAGRRDVNKSAKNFDGLISLAGRFSQLSRLITRDLNNYRSSPTFYLYTKDNIATYLANPYRYEKQLRAAINYVYVASPHFRRLIQYFVGLSDFAYIVEPYKIDPKKAN